MKTQENLEKTCEINYTPLDVLIPFYSFRNFKKISREKSILKEKTYDLAAFITINLSQATLYYLYFVK